MDIHSYCHGGLIPRTPIGKEIMLEPGFVFICAQHPSHNQFLTDYSDHEDLRNCGDCGDYSVLTMFLGMQSGRCAHEKSIEVPMLLNYGRAFLPNFNAHSKKGLHTSGVTDRKQPKSDVFPHGH
jgi:hypothetical protein